LRTYLVLLALVFARPEHASIWWGIPLLLLGVALHVYAKGSLRQDEEVSMAGPYRFVRHPFYLANLLVDESIALMSACWPLVLLLPVWWLLVYLPTMRQEESHLSDLFPTVCPSYQRRVPRLIPLRRPLPPDGTGFSWKNRNIAADTVIPRALRMLGYPLVFLVWGEIRARGARAFSGGGVGMLCAASALLTLYALSWVVARHLRDRERILPEKLPTAALRALTTAGVLSVAGLLHQLEVESDVVLALLGCFVLVASIALYAMKGQARLAAEGVGLVGFAILCELPWLSAIPILVYATLMLDRRIGEAQRPHDPQPAIASRQLPPALLHTVILVAGVTLAVAKELL